MTNTHAVTPKGIGEHSVVVGLTAEDCRQLSQRHLTAARALLETVKPKTDMELIVVKAVSELLIETATALLGGRESTVTAEDEIEFARRRT